MGKDNTIQDLTPFNIASFSSRDERRKHWFEAIGYNFCDYFVKHVAKCNGPELPSSEGLIFLGNKGEEGGIEGTWNFPSYPRLLH